MMQESTASRNDLLMKLIEPHDEIEPISRILTYCDEIKAEYEEYMQILLDTNILIRWEMPLYQTVCRSIVKAPLMEQLSAFADEIRSDRITTDESELILENWNTLCKQYKLPNKPECFARWKNRDTKFRKGETPEETLRHTIVAHLARDLNRTLHQVYQHFVSMYGYKAYGAYSPVEEKLMDICFNYDPSNAVIILSIILQREPRALYKRMNIHFNGNVQQAVPRVNWNLQLVESFLQSLMELCGCSDILDLCDKAITRGVWVSLSEILNVPYVRLRDLWFRKLHIQLFSEEPIYLSKVRLKVLKILRKSNFKRWRDIDWKYVRQKFPTGYTTTFLYYYTVMKVYKCVKGYTKISLMEVLDEVEKSRNLQVCRRCLKRLRFNKDGALEFLNEKAEARRDRN